ncbi:MAG: Gfo/Idh/MocA family oxidoreductase [Saprospiraceae bacterium]|nr:Gfo/Idh/MocA family oxidoreductase [Saprospiraceae bacterium]
MKVGIIGLGNIGKKHAAAIALLPEFQLIATCELNGTGLTDIPNHPTVDTFLNQKYDFDIVSVCSPNHLHKTHTMKALQAGYDVICEKPFSTNSSDCEEMISAAEDNGKNIFCVMQNRFSPISTWLKKIIDTHALGSIYMINVACYWNRNQDYYASSNWRGKADLDGGTLYTQFSHYVDTLYWMFGPIHIENALFANFNHGDTIDFEDSCSFNFTTQDKVIGSFMYTTANYDHNFESTLTIIGEKGTVKISGQYMNKVEYSDIPLDDNIESMPSNNIANLSQVYLNAGHAKENQSIPMTSAKDGLNVVRIIESVYSYKK